MDILPKSFYCIKVLISTFPLANSINLFTMRLIIISMCINKLDQLCAFFPWENPLVMRGKEITNQLLELLPALCQVLVLEGIQSRIEPLFLRSSQC